MNTQDQAVSHQVFSLVMFGCALFVVLTAVAMWFYPGGTYADQSASGYSFSTNFFSELGMTVTRSGEPNTVSAILWFVAMSLAGAGLVLFFIAFRQFFTGSRWGRVLSGLGSVVGVFSGICFVGVAFTPANLFLGAHVRFVLWAFQAFPVAAILYAVAILREPAYPDRYGWAFLGFAVLLVFYVILLIAGPGQDLRQGLVIQAAGQKIIVYASIISIFIQPFMPDAASKMWEQLGFKEKIEDQTIKKDCTWGKKASDVKVNKKAPLFPRISI